MNTERLPCRAEVVRLYKSGMTTKAIGEQFRVTRKAVHAALRRSGISTKSPRVIADLAAVVDLYRSGLSAQKVADRVGVCRETVIRALREAGEPIRDRANTGERNGRYKDGSQSRLYRNIATKGLCEKCGATDHLAVHHRDFDHYNNTEENLEVLCASCHMSLHKTEYWAAVRDGREPRRSNGPIGWERANDAT